MAAPDLHRQISKIQFFVEPPVDFAGLNFDVTGLPKYFIQSADRELNLSGELIDYIKNHTSEYNETIDINVLPAIISEIKNIARIPDHQSESFFKAKSQSELWELYYAAGQSGARYTILVEFGTRLSNEFKSENLRRQIYSEYEKLYAKESVHYLLANPKASTEDVANLAMSNASHAVMIRYGIPMSDMLSIIEDGLIDNPRFSFLSGSEPTDDDDDNNIPLTPEEIAEANLLYNKLLLNYEHESFEHNWWRRWLSPTIKFVCLSVLIIIMIIVGIILIINIGDVIVVIGWVIGGIIGIALLVFLFYLIVQWCNNLIENSDLLEARRDEKNKLLEQEERRKKQSRVNKDAEEIANTIKTQINSQQPIENILLNINTNRFSDEAKMMLCESIAKAISSLNMLKEDEKGRLFSNIDADTISKILNYFNDSENITILQQLNNEKKEDVLMRFSLSKRSLLRPYLMEGT